MKRAIVIFTRDPSRERKRFGVGQIADARLRAALVERTVATAAACEDVADVIVAGEALQSGEMFEDRLLSALHRIPHLDTYDRVVLIGTDTPDLTEHDLRRALTSDVAVVGPSMDGGFYLLGVAGSELDETLRGLPWQTSRVGAALERRLTSFVRLPQRRDLDDALDAHVSLSRLRLLFGPLDNCVEPAAPIHAERLTTPAERREPPRSRGSPLMG